MLFLGNVVLFWWVFFIGVFLFYVNIFLYIYVLDDYLIIINNDLVQGGWFKIGELLIVFFVWGGGFNDGLYCLFIFLIFVLEVVVFGLNILMFSYLINVGLFVVICVFFF